MNLKGLLLALTAAGLLTGCASTQDKYFLETESPANVYVQGPHRNIQKVAIMPFKAPTELIGSSVSDMFVTEFLKAGRYDLVERGQMAQVLNESELALAGLSQAKAVEIGNMMGADGVIIGTVDEYGTIAERGKSYAVVGISTRMIDCTSGKVVWSVDYADRSRDRDVALAQYSRAVVHSMVAALYAEWKEQR
ncbi:MAG: GNA1162 family protein [Kiritimatiellia bacterium]